MPMAAYRPDLVHPQGGWDMDFGRSEDLTWLTRLGKYMLGHYRRD